VSEFVYTYRCGTPFFVAAGWGRAVWRFVAGLDTVGALFI
jgi:hypothetical protein